MKGFREKIRPDLGFMNEIFISEAKRKQCMKTQRHLDAGMEEGKLAFCLFPLLNVHEASSFIFFFASLLLLFFFCLEGKYSLLEDKLISLPNL